MTTTNQGAYNLYAKSSDNTQFPTTLSGNTVTVKALANSTSQAKNATVTVYLATAEGMTPVAQKTVAVSQQAGGSTPVGDQIVTDFMVESTYPAGFPASSGDKQMGPESYTFDGVTYTLAGGLTGNGYYRGKEYQGTRYYLMIGKKGAYIDLPANATKALTSVECFVPGAASANVLVGISTLDGTDVAGGAAIKWEYQNGGSSTNIVDRTYTYNLTGTQANTKYRLYITSENANGYNAQIYKLTLNYGESSGGETPTLEVSPLDVTLGNTAGATQTFTVTTTAAWTATASGAGFTVNPTSGTGNATVTVTASAANSDSSEKTLGSVLVSATGVGATKTVNVKQAAGGGSVNPGTTTITFTSPDIATPSIPLPANAGHDRTAYVIGGQTYYLYADAAQNGKYQWQDNSGYTGAVAPFTGVYLKMGYFELPAVAGKKLTSVTLTSTGGMGGGVMAGIYGVDGQPVVAAESFTKDTPLTLGLDGASNTAYRIQITAGNAQIHQIEMIYSDGGVTPPPTPEITAVNPTSLSFPKEGGNETIAVTVANQGASALSVSGLTSPFSASVSGNTVTVSAQANTGAAVNQTLTISVAGGNSMTVPVSIADGQGGGEPAGGLTLVTTVADLANGTYYMAGWANNGAYNVWNGTLMSGQCMTSPYSFADGKLTATTTFDDLTEVTLEAVSGVADAYYIKNMDGKYLTVSKDGKNALALVDEAGNNSWTLSDFDEHGVKASSNAFSSNMFTSVGASSKFIRSYAVSNTTGIGGIAFFKKN